MPTCYLCDAMKVYLTGPVSGAQSDAMAAWRGKVKEILPETVQIVDPTASPVDQSLAYQRPENDTDRLARLMHGRLVIDRNKHLIQSSDVILANFLGTHRASIGSIGELFWAHAFRVPIVIIREAAGNVHDHAMLNAIASVVTHSIDDACAAVTNMLRTSTRVGTA